MLILRWDIMMVMMMKDSFHSIFHLLSLPILLPKPSPLFALLSSVLPYLHFPYLFSLSFSLPMPPLLPTPAPFPLPFSSQTRGETHSGDLQGERGVLEVNANNYTPPHVAQVYCSSVFCCCCYCCCLLLCYCCFPHLRCLLRL